MSHKGTMIVYTSIQLQLFTAVRDVNSLFYYLYQHNILWFCII